MHPASYYDWLVLDLRVCIMMFYLKSTVSNIDFLDEEYYGTQV